MEQAKRDVTYISCLTGENESINIAIALMRNFKNLKPSHDFKPQKLKISTKLVTLRDTKFKNS
jgi:hypothetical protein